MLVIPASAAARAPPRCSPGCPRSEPCHHMVPRAGGSAQCPDLCALVAPLAPQGGAWWLFASPIPGWGPRTPLIPPLNMGVSSIQRTWPSLGGVPNLPSTHQLSLPNSLVYLRDLAWKCCTHRLPLSPLSPQSLHPPPLISCMPPASVWIGSSLGLRVRWRWKCENS